MKKKVLIVLMSLILTGCTGNYMMNYNGEVLTEEIVLKDLDDESLKDTDLKLDDFLNQDFYYDKKEKTKFEKNIDGNNITLKKTSSIEEFKNSRLVHECFKYNLIKDEEDYLLINLFGEFRCEKPNKFVFKTSLPVMKHNGKQRVLREGVTIEYNLKQYNPEKGILIEIQKEGLTTAKQIGRFRLYLAIFIILFIIIIRALMFKIKNKIK